MPVLAANYKQHILLKLKLEQYITHKLNFIMSIPFIWI
jgi:hypothetical protein